MAQTLNGEKIYEYYCKAGLTECSYPTVLEFAHDWMEFFNDYYLHIGNQMYSWHKWCDEFAEWVIENAEYNPLQPEDFGLIIETENEEANV